MAAERGAPEWNATYCTTHGNFLVVNLSLSFKIKFWPTYKIQIIFTFYKMVSKYIKNGKGGDDLNLFCC